MHIVGFFSCTDLPACFTVISTILARAISSLIVDFWLVNVVDLMLITTLAAMLTDMGVARDVCVTLLGIYAVEDAKNASDHRLGMVGWGFDLGWRVVSILLRVGPFARLLWPSFACMSSTSQWVISRCWCLMSAYILLSFTA